MATTEAARAMRAAGSSASTRGRMAPTRTTAASARYGSEQAKAATGARKGSAATRGAAMQPAQVSAVTRGPAAAETRGERGCTVPKARAEAAPANASAAQPWAVGPAAKGGTQRSRRRE